MKDKDEILRNIKNGNYQLTKHRGRSSIWKIFADIKKSDGTIIVGYVCCRKCMSFYKYDGIRSSNLNRHKCFQRVADNSGSEIIPQEVQCETSNCSMDEIRKVGNTKDVKDGHTEEVKDVYIENTYAGIFENVKVRNPHELVSSAEDSQPCELPPQKRKKSSIYDLTPKVKERNFQQLNSLCEMIKVDLQDAPEDLFFIAKWKIMDILHEVQSKRLERESSS